MIISVLIGLVVLVVLYVLGLMVAGAVYGENASFLETVRSAGWVLLFLMVCYLVGLSVRFLVNA